MQDWGIARRRSDFLARGGRWPPWLMGMQGRLTPRLNRAAVVNQDMPSPNSPPDIEKLAHDLRAGGRAALARAITLIESRRGDQQAAARELVQALLPDTGTAVRVGITGSPGVGKSTTIDA